MQTLQSSYSVACEIYPSKNCPKKKIDWFIRFPLYSFLVHIRMCNHNTEGDGDKIDGLGKEGEGVNFALGAIYLQPPSSNLHVVPVSHFMRWARVSRPR